MATVTGETELGPEGKGREEKGEGVWKSGGARAREAEGGGSMRGGRVRKSEAARAREAEGGGSMRGGRVRTSEAARARKGQGGGNEREGGGVRQEHPVNQERKLQNKAPANTVLLRGCGSRCVVALDSCTFPVMSPISGDCVTAPSPKIYFGRVGLIT